MLFDLQGKRRRVVQATYHTLAVLMGGGLVFFGIGGDVSGGLLSGGGILGGDDGSSGDDVTKEQIEKNEKALQRNPRAEGPLKELARDHFQLAVRAAEQGGGDGLPEEATQELRTAAAFWQRYLKVSDKPDPSLAGLALQIYGPGALEQPKEAQEAAAIRARAENTPQAYIQLVEYATRAGDTRTADLAGLKAVDLADKDDREDARAEVKNAKKRGKAPPPGQVPQG